MPRKLSARFSRGGFCAEAGCAESAEVKKASDSTASQDEGVDMRIMSFRRNTGGTQESEA